MQLMDKIWESDKNVFRLIMILFNKYSFKFFLFFFEHNTEFSIAIFESTLMNIN